MEIYVKTILHIFSFFLAFKDFISSDNKVVIIILISVDF